MSRNIFDRSSVSHPSKRVPQSLRFCGALQVIDFRFQGNDTTLIANPAIDVPITKTGMYYLWYVICDRSLVEVNVTGMTVWKNPFGYLPGMMAPFETFYGFMALGYLALGAVWFVQYVRYWKDILALQVRLPTNAKCVPIIQEDRLTRFLDKRRHRYRRWKSTFLKMFWCPFPPLLLSG